MYFQVVFSSLCQKHKGLFFLLFTIRTWLSLEVNLTKLWKSPCDCVPMEICQHRASRIHQSQFRFPILTLVLSVVSTHQFPLWESGTPFICLSVSTILPTVVCPMSSLLQAPDMLNQKPEVSNAFQSLQTLVVQKMQRSRK